jgi:uncharacterized membrane protein
MEAIARWTPRVGYWVLAFLALGVALVAFRFITFDPAVAPPELRANMEGRTLVFVTHTLAGGVAMVVGIWQFLPRTRRTRWHRIEGRIYVTACFIGAPTGFIIAWFTTAGTFAAVGFATLAVLWFGATLTGFIFARRRDYVRHRRWMIRSYALTCAAITLRLITAVGGVLGLGFYSPYIAAAWLCWIVNLALVEIWLATRRQPTLREVLATG